MISLERGRERKRERERILQTQKRIAVAQRTAALRRANYAEQARPSSYNIGTPDLDEFPIARHDIKCCDKSPREMSYGLAFVTLMRNFITRPFLIVALMTCPILSRTLRSLLPILSPFIIVARQTTWFSICFLFWRLHGKFTISINISITYSSSD